MITCVLLLYGWKLFKTWDTYGMIMTAAVEIAKAHRTDKPLIALGGGVVGDMGGGGGPPGVFFFFFFGFLLRQRYSNAGRALYSNSGRLLFVTSGTFFCRAEKLVLITHLVKI